MGPQILLTIVFTVLALPDSARAQMTCTTSVLDLTVRQVILNLHNDLRKRVAIGVARPAPRGQNIYALTYNCSLEDSAQKAAEKCSGLNSNPSDRPNIGENVYVYSGPAVKVAAFKHAIVKWRNPAGWNSGNVFTAAMSTTGLRNFAQMAWGSTTLIGCGYQHCGSFQSVVCHYLTEGAKVNEVAYELGQGCTRNQDCTTFAFSTCDRGLRLCIAPPGVSLPPTGGSVVTPTQSSLNCAPGSPLTANIRNAILRRHNSLRSKVAKMRQVDGHNFKKGTNRMFALRYSCDLEARANRLADACPPPPDPPVQNPAPTRGQNFYKDVANPATPISTSFVTAITAWTAEGATFVEGTNLGTDPNTLAAVGRFAQMINAKTYEIGCGYGSCEAARKDLLCIYRYARSDNGKPYPPITTGTGCTTTGCQTLFSNATCNTTSGLCQLP